MKKAILFLFMFIFCGLSYGATLTPNNVPKVNTGGSTPKIEDSSIWNQGSNVGIGTTDPQYSLDVAGDINAVTDITVNGTSVCLSDATNCPPFLNGWTDGGSQVYLTNSADNVGIGTINPQAKLHVKGGIIADGSFSGVQMAYGQRIDGDVSRKIRFSDTTGTYNSNLRLDIDTTSGTAEWDSTSAVPISTWLMTGMNLQVDGTISATAFVGDGSGLTGISSSGGGWQDGGTNVYLTATSDNVAIGTTTPTQKLTVVGTVSATSFVGDGSALTGIGAGGWVDGGTNIYASPTTDNVGIGTTTPIAALMIENAGTQDSLRVSDSVGDATPFVINSVGNVGIGTTGMGAKLSVGSTSQTTIDGSGNIATTSTTGSTDTLNITNNSLTSANGLDVSSSSASQTAPLGIFTQSGASSGGTLRVNQSSATSTGRATHITNAGTFDSLLVEDVATDATPFVITSDGNVGIGTTGPTQKLHVVGTVSATAFTGDGSGLTGVGASGWTDAGTSIFPTATSDQIAIGTTTPVSGAALTVLGTIAGSGSGPLSITNGNVGIGTFATPTVLLHVGNTAGSPTSVGANDVYIQNDLEVDGTIYGNGAGLTNAAGWTDGTNVVYTTVAADKVGIGTSTPNRLLSIHTSDPDTYPSFGVCNSVGECFRVEANSTNDTSRVSIGSAQNVSLDFNANDVTLLKLESSGNVGIGTVGSGGAIFVSPDNTCSKCGPNNSDVWACASVACP